MSGQARRAGGDDRRQQAEPERAARERLLDAVIAHFTAEGLADQSLRRIAEAVGSSHRMLLYHFGSKDGLLLEVVREVEARTQERLAASGRGRRRRDRRADPADVGLRRRSGAGRLRAALLRALRAGAAGRRVDPAAPDDDIAHWLDANVALSTPLGVPRRRGPDPRHASGWRSSAACCSTSSPPATAPAWRPRSRSSPQRYRGRWWERQAETGSSDRAS